MVWNFVCFFIIYVETFGKSFICFIWTICKIKRIYVKVWFVQQFCVIMIYVILTHLSQSKVRVWQRQCNMFLNLATNNCIWIIFWLYMNCLLTIYWKNYLQHVILISNIIKIWQIHCCYIQYVYTNWSSITKGHKEFIKLLV